jgi:hypothetical protein
VITADQMLAHVVGDYVLQSDWMAAEKTKRSVATLVHVALYTLCFLPLTQSPAALAFIAASHFVIDRWRIARHVSWAKNFIAPRSGWPRSWAECSATGYDPSKPPFMAVWLMIIVDQAMHVACNGLALRFL